MGNLPEHRPRSGLGYQRLRRAAHDRGRHEHPVPRVFRCRGRGMMAQFLDRERLSRQCCFLHMQILRLQQPGIGGDHVAGREANHVSRRDLAAKDFSPLSAATHGGGRGHAHLERLGGQLRPVCLNEFDDDAEDHHGPDDHRVRKSPATAEMMLASTRMAMSGLANRRRIWTMSACFRTLTGSLGPNCFSRSDACSSDSPRSEFGSAAVESGCVSTPRSWRSNDEHRSVGVIDDA